MNQPFGGVVFVFFGFALVLLPLRVALRGVAHLGVGCWHLAKWLGIGVAGELVGFVVAPHARLVPAGGAVADCVVAVGFLGQAQGFVGFGLCEAAWPVVGVAGLAQFALYLRDVACGIVVVVALGQCLVLAVFDFDAQGALQRVPGEGFGDTKQADLATYTSLRRASGPRCRSPTQRYPDIAK